MIYYFTSCKFTTLIWIYCSKYCKINDVRDFVCYTDNRTQIICIIFKEGYLFERVINSLHFLRFEILMKIVFFFYEESECMTLTGNIFIASFIYRFFLYSNETNFMHIQFVIRFIRTLKCIYANSHRY